MAFKLQIMSSVVVVHGLSCPSACGIFLEQGLNPYPLCWQANLKIYIYLFLAALGFVALLAFLWMWRAGATLCYRVQQTNSHALYHQGSPNGSFLSPWALNFVGPLEFYP